MLNQIVKKLAPNLKMTPFLRNKVITYLSKWMADWYQVDNSHNLPNLFTNGLRGYSDYTDEELLAEVVETSPRNQDEGLDQDEWSDQDEYDSIVRQIEHGLAEYALLRKEGESFEIGSNSELPPEQPDLTKIDPELLKKLGIPVPK